MVPIFENLNVCQIPAFDIHALQISGKGQKKIAFIVPETHFNPEMEQFLTKIASATGLQFEADAYLVQYPEDQSCLVNQLANQIDMEILDRFWMQSKGPRFTI